MRFKDLSGQKFESLTVQNIDHRNKHGHFMWLCICDCGNRSIVSTCDLTSGKTKSCGCYKRNKTIARNKSHGLSKTSEYRSWKAMKTRCYNKNVKSYADYGGRGITISPRWLNSFDNFLSDMGFKPYASYSIDRIDHNGNYEAGNCRWASKTEQNRNTRQNHLISTEWGLITIAEAAEKSGVSLSTIKKRIKNGISETHLLDKK